MKILTARLKRDIYGYLRNFNTYNSYEGFIQYVRRRCDLRTTVDKTYIDFVSRDNDLKTVNFQELEKEIRNKRRSRNENKWEFLSIFQNPFVKDYIANKKHLSKVFSDHLNFSHNRNHWAKNSTDYNLINILLRKTENQF